MVRRVGRLGLGHRPGNWCRFSSGCDAVSKGTCIRPGRTALSCTTNATGCGIKQGPAAGGGNSAGPVSPRSETGRGRGTTSPSRWHRNLAIQWQNAGDRVIVTCRQPRLGGAGAFAASARVCPGVCGVEAADRRRTRPPLCPVDLCPWGEEIWDVAARCFSSSWGRKSRGAAAAGRQGRRGFSGARSGVRSAIRRPRSTTAWRRSGPVRPAGGGRDG